VFRHLRPKLRLPTDSKSVADSIEWWDEWSIGIYSGDSPIDLTPAENAINPVLTWEDVSDVPARFVADPFMIRANDMWYMFFEVMNRKSDKGEIGLAISDDGFTWEYQQIVLAEPYHLSYPYVFEWMNEYYMIPESYTAGSVRLYKAKAFPTTWTYAGTLLAGSYYVDPSILRYQDKWWLFVDASADRQHNTLRLFWAETLTGVWFEHPQSPIIAGNPHIARPAGRLIVLENKLFRYAQDCYPKYGTQVYAFEITQLSTTNYAEQESDKNPVVKASGAGWNESGMHQIDPHLTDERRWIASVDGLCWKQTASRGVATR
jgi:hypothetical protein